LQYSVFVQSLHKQFSLVAHAPSSLLLQNPFAGAHFATVKKQSLHVQSSPASKSQVPSSVQVFVQ